LEGQGEAILLTDCSRAELCEFVKNRRRQLGRAVNSLATVATFVAVAVAAAAAAASQTAAVKRLRQQTWSAQREIWDCFQNITV